ncbi:MAG: hypothetical protein HY097_07010 [Nitrospinae bacterium]|nr:hypothetical protein [Nitrospinota bacterium]
MRESIEEIFQSVVKISQSDTVTELKIIEKTKSILKARLYFSEELFVQVYVNTRKPKRSYALILNDKRIFGKDCVFNIWHLHPFENPDKHDESEFAKKSVTVEEFVEAAFFTASEKLKIV